MRLLTTLICLAALSACGSFPTAGAPTRGGSDYPALLPLSDLLSEGAPSDATTEADEALAARIAGLNARADRLRRASF